MELTDRVAWNLAIKYKNIFVLKAIVGTNSEATLEQILRTFKIIQDNEHLHGKQSVQDKDTFANPAIPKTIPKIWVPSAADNYI